MKERGIIFNAEMVRAILDGRKTQTRRILSNRQLNMIDSASSMGECYPLESGSHHENSQSYYREWCPFGLVGDRLWVRETWSLLGNEDGCAVDWNDNIVFDQKNAARIYRASCFQKPNHYGLWSIPGHDFEFEGRWKPSIHMPRWASRITLEITGVRVERLNSISEDDARAEGVGSAVWFAGKGVPEDGWTSLGEMGAQKAYHLNSFATLWESIYGENSWQANPWVWVVEFKRVEAE